MRPAMARHVWRPYFYPSMACCVLCFILHVGATPTSFKLDNNQSLGTVAMVQTLADSLYEKWNVMYGLDGDTSQPPSSISAPEDPFLPLAPHLRDCGADAIEADRADSRRADGALPGWWGEGNDEGKGPDPPWIRGSDEDNVALTRQAQADIWRQHHPVDCRAKGLKFLLGSWVEKGPHGLGSRFHLMTALLALAMDHGRILVLVPGSFSRAIHEGCQGKKEGSLDCYFYPMADPKCIDHVMELLNDEKNWRPPRNDTSLTDLVASSLKVVESGGERIGMETSEFWGQPWKRAPSSIDLLGVVTKSMRMDKRSWWRTQAIRYMMRWPTPYLCHVTNKVRHAAMGKETAKKIVEAYVGQKQAEKLNNKMSGRGKGKYETKSLANFQIPLVPREAIEREAYMPRPIVSIHVRQGDKAREMKLVSFASHMWMTERLRFHVPDLETVWLSTEMETVVAEATSYKSWKFLYTNIKRQVGTMSMGSYERLAGSRKLLDVSFANLLISSECDFFVGALGSNWNRLINELRLTTGRFKAGYIGLNHGEY